MSKLLLFLVLVSAVGCAACGEVRLRDPGGEPADARASAPDARPGTPDAGPGAPDANPSAPDAGITGPDAGEAPDASPGCSAGDVQFVDPDTGVCYLLFLDELDWFEARDACASLGADTHLVTLRTISEHVDVTLELAAGIEVWLGASDVASEGSFVWVTGEPVTLAFWAEGEPNNGGMNGEDCAILIGFGERAGNWDDRGCGSARPYVCERN